MVFEQGTDGDVEVILPAGLVSDFQPGEIGVHRLVCRREHHDWMALKRRQQAFAEIGWIGRGQPEALGIEFTENHSG